MFCAGTNLKLIKRLFFCLFLKYNFFKNQTKDCSFFASCTYFSLNEERRGEELNVIAYLNLDMFTNETTQMQ